MWTFTVLDLQFLNDRTQQTRVGNSLSDKTSITIGVVQGSIIGPLIFMLFINDITLLFSGISVRVSSIPTILNCTSYYVLIPTTTTCKMAWTLYMTGRRCGRLTLFNQKCNLMYVGNTQSKPSLKYAEMAIVDEVNDLGVIVDSRRNFNTHIRQAVARTFVSLFNL